MSDFLVPGCLDSSLPLPEPTGTEHLDSASGELAGSPIFGWADAALAGHEHDSADAVAAAAAAARARAAAAAALAKKLRAKEQSACEAREAQ